MITTTLHFGADFCQHGTPLAKQSSTALIAALQLDMSPAEAQMYEDARCGFPSILLSAKTTIQVTSKYRSADIVSRPNCTAIATEMSSIGIMDRQDPHLTTKSLRPTRKQHSKISA